MKLGYSACLALCLFGTLVAAGTKQQKSPKESQDAVSDPSWGGSPRSGWGGGATSGWGGWGGDYALQSILFVGLPLLLVPLLFLWPYLLHGGGGHSSGGGGGWGWGWKRSNDDGAFQKKIEQVAQQVLPKL